MRAIGGAKFPWNHVGKYSRIIRNVDRVQLHRFADYDQPEQEIWMIWE